MWEVENMEQLDSADLLYTYSVKYLYIKSEIEETYPFLQCGIQTLLFSLT